jgi:hypothetical protein
VRRARIDEHLQTLVHRMVELETARLLPGQRVVVGRATTAGCSCWSTASR